MVGSFFAPAAREMFKPPNSLHRQQKDPFAEGYGATWVWQSQPFPDNL